MLNWMEKQITIAEAIGWAMTLAILIVILEDAFFRQLLATCR